MTCFRRALECCVATLAFVIAAPGAASQQPGGDRVLIHAGTLLAAPGEAPKARQTIVVVDGRVAAVHDGFVDEPGARIIDLTDQFVLPGLIDLHVHLDQQLAPGYELRALKESDEDATLIAAHNAAITLQAGFTTVRNLGGSPAIKAVRDAAAEGWIPSPIIVDAGAAISISGGHADFHGFSERVNHAFRADVTTRCDGADDCRRATREGIRLGADVIKIAATGGVLSNIAGGLGLQMTGEEIRAVVDTAHSFGRKVAVHAHAKAGIDAALRAGADTIEHDTYADAETLALFRKTGAVMVPTLSALTYVMDHIDALDLSPAQVAKAREAADAARRTFREAVHSGVKIGFGTDASVAPHGTNAHEFKLLTDFGMTPMQAIRSATIVAADALGQSSDIGSIKVGRRADIIAVRSSPLTDIEQLEHVRFVMARGIVYRLDDQEQAVRPTGPRG